MSGERKYHASTFNAARRVAEASAAGRSRRCHRNYVCWLLLGRLVARGGSPDVVLCPDVAPYVDSRFDCRDLLQRSVIHYGTAKASAVTCAPRAGQSLRRHARRAQSAPISRGGDGCILCRRIGIQIDLEGNDGNLD
jgi:hypothetical protein